jgi:SAM-dependent methyltransferase
MHAKPLCTKRQTCRLCESSAVELVVPIKPTPVADAYIHPSAVDGDDPLFPLDLYQCRDCGHAQILDVVDPAHLFRDYIYSTSISLGLVEHFRKYAAEMVSRFNLGAGKLAVDIGSNDGTLLRFFKEAGLNVCGIDPARAIAEKAMANGIPTLPEFLTLSVAEQLVKAHGQASLVTANNVFAHSDKLAEMADCVARLLAPNGVFIFEVSYLLDIVDRYLFDTIYHEHLCYHSVAPLTRFFASHDLELFDVQRIANKGGSIRGFVQRKGGARPCSEECTALLKLEAERRLGDPATLRAYADRIEKKKHEVVALLKSLKASGKKIAGFGASATVTTLLYNFELAPWLEFLVDDNASRHGLVSPGHHLPVHSPSELHERGIDVVVILAWQYAEPIMKKHKPFLEKGGAFLIPLVEPRIITAASA